MKVLIVTGDKNFKPGNARYDLMAAVADIEALYWGPGALNPSPRGTAFDVVTSQDPFWRGLVAMRLARRYHARFNVQLHADLHAQSFIKQLLARITLRRADSVRVVSEKLKADVLSIAPRARVSVLPIYVDLAPFKTVMRRSHDGKVVLWVGRFEDEKDPLAAIEIFKKVRAAVPTARLVMLGAGSLAGALAERARALPIEFPGWQDPVPYLETADVVLSTSKAEAWGASVLEALAAGVPVVAPDIGVVRAAGASVFPRTDLAAATIQKLTEGGRGILTLNIMNKEEWQAAWLTAL